MIDKHELRVQFSARLHEALDEAGIRARGRGADILEKLKSVGVTKTPQAVSKWLNGGAIPEQDSLTVIAHWLGVRREWLEYGVLPRTDSSNVSCFKGENEAANVNVSSMPRSLGKVPLISWVQAGSWCEALTNVELGEAELWLSCPVATSKNSYALRVVGDSMTNPGQGRTYPHGSIIFVDPEVTPHNGDRVIARLPSTNEATFKVLVSDAGKQYLKPINPQYPIIEINEEVQLCGKVVGLFIAD